MESVQEQPGDRSGAAPRFLVIDDEHVSRMHRLKRTLHQPAPYGGNPVIQPDCPWERTMVSHYGTVLYDEALERFRFWYHAMPGLPDDEVTVDGRTSPGNRALLCYATSTDGMTWEKPVLGQVEFEGSTENNIVRIGRTNPEGVGILFDPEDPDPARRYKALYWESTLPAQLRDDCLVTLQSSGADGIWVSFSSDGLVWTDYEANPVNPSFSDTSHYVVRDPRTGRYMAYGRFGLGRVISLIDSDDFVHWTRPRMVLEPDRDEAASPPPDSQYYGMAVDVYENIYVGGLWVYHRETDGCIDTELAVSRDGEHWQHVGGRGTFLPLGPKGAPDDGMVRATTRYITHGDSIYVYYGMVNGPHPRSPGEQVQRDYPRCLGLGMLRRDGFVSLGAGNDNGMLLTKPLWFDGQPLHLNVDVAPGGSAEVSICHWGALDLTQAGDALEGFERSCPITADTVDGEVRWKDADSRSIAGQFVRLRIRLRNAELYSFWFE